MSDVSSITSGELLTLYSGVLIELRRRGLVRTSSNPVADIGEKLFCEAMGWAREHHQGREFDAATREGARVYIKSRRMIQDRTPIRSGTLYDKDGFDIVAIVIFDPDFAVDRAVLVPRDAALRHLRFSKRQKGWYIGLTQRFWRDPELIDVTDHLDLHHRDLMSLTS